MADGGTTRLRLASSDSGFLRIKAQIPVADGLQSFLGFYHGQVGLEGLACGVDIGLRGHDFACQPGDWRGRERPVRDISRSLRCSRT